MWFAVLCCFASRSPAETYDQAPRSCLRQLPPLQRCDGALAALFPHEFKFWCACDAASCCGAGAYRQIIMQVTGSLHLVGDFLRILRPRQ